MTENWILLKFGGTSVAGRRQWETIASLVESRRAEGFRVLLVCSAVAGVTNLLNALVYRSASAEQQEEILETHRRLGRELGVDEEHWLVQAEARLQKCVDDLTKNLLTGIGQRWWQWVSG